MKILLVGEGGQGVQLAAELLAHAAFTENKETSLIPNFGVEQRGGVSIAFVVINEDASYPKFDKADYLVLLCDRGFERIKRYICQETVVLAGPEITISPEIEGKWVKIDGGVTPLKVANMLMLGQLLSLSKVIGKDSLKEVLEDKLKEKFANDPALKDLNFQAIGE
jgi:2-oxoglutarate ferredoxin oxidoreductase subunit gamma